MDNDCCGTKKILHKQVYDIDIDKLICWHTFRQQILDCRWSSNLIYSNYFQLVIVLNRVWLWWIKIITSRSISEFDRRKSKCDWKHFSSYTDKDIFQSVIFRWEVFVITHFLSLKHIQWLQNISNEQKKR